MFGEILSYVYSGNLHVSLDKVQTLYQAADLLQLEYVRDTCSSYMARNVERSTCVDLYRFADVFSVKIVLKRCLQWIYRKFTEVASSEEFCSLSLNQLTEIISHDELDVKEEKAVWEAVVRWVKHSTDDRLHHLPSILPYVRFNLLSSDDTAAIMEHPLVREDPGSFEVIRKVTKELETSSVTRRIGMDTLEMALLFNIEDNEIICMNPKEGKYIKISLPSNFEDKYITNMTVTSDNIIYVLTKESDDQLSVLEYNHAGNEWEHAGMSSACNFVRDALEVEEFFVELHGHFFLVMVKVTANSNIVLTRRYNRHTDEWRECAQLQFDNTEEFCHVVPCSPHLYVFMNSDVHRYDPIQDKWEQRTPPRTIPVLCTAVPMGTEIF
ncbi:kelch repeat and BTB domain-containing protein 12-like isoform X2 [Branchiostoma lanceolatum]|uniref:kelch repeat and BTB domain-containing protein 12-like isoform X2 n=1 Tax=Branchiostoma lanceolatum TaxID=7740 RepID=UPI0034519D51